MDTQGTTVENMDIKGTTVEEERQIKQEISRLECALNEVVNRIDVLFNRLTPALRPDVQDACKAEPTPPEAELVELASYVREVRYIAERQSFLINSALDRLEI